MLFAVFESAVFVSDERVDLRTNGIANLRDITTPRAMVGSMERMLLGTVLSEPSRQMLIQWMINSSTGLRRIRAG